MAVVVDFENIEQFRSYIDSKTIETPLGKGTEGTCYRGKDGKAYKIYPEFGYREFYSIDDIVTQDEIELRSFAFPETIFTINGNMEAYTSRLVEKNLFDNEHLTVKGLRDFDFDRLICAYNIMQEDTRILTEKGIAISDLTGNILFDGTNLVAIDTCCYERNAIFDNNSASNKELIDEAIKHTFNALFEDEESEGMFIDLNQDVILFLRDIEANFKLKTKAKVYVNK